MVRRGATKVIERVGQGAFTAISYVSGVDPAVHLAFVKGDLSGKQPVLTRVHRACMMGDVLGSAGCDCGRQLAQAFERIHQEGRGVLVYLQKEGSPAARLECTHVSNEEMVPGSKDATRLREFGVGAQILKDLGLSRLRLLTNNPKKIVGLESYSLEVVEQIPLTDGKKAPRIAARTPRPPRRTQR